LRARKKAREVVGFVERHFPRTFIEIVLKCRANPIDIWA
jgi:hypothetical protein